MSAEDRMPISELKENQGGVVVDIDGGDGMKSKLESLGIRKGVRIMKKSALIGKGPVIVQVGLSEVAMGYGIAARVFVEVER